MQISFNFFLVQHFFVLDLRILGPDYLTKQCSLYLIGFTHPVFIVHTPTQNVFLGLLIKHFDKWYTDEDKQFSISFNLYLTDYSLWLFIKIFLEENLWCETSETFCILKIISENSVSKHLLPSILTALGHQDQVPKHLWSTMRPTT